MLAELRCGAWGALLRQKEHALLGGTADARLAVAPAQPVEFCLSAGLGSLLVVAVAVLRIYLGWAYVGDRLLSAAVRGPSQKLLAGLPLETTVHASCSAWPGIHPVDILPAVILQPLGSEASGAGLALASCAAACAN